LLLIKNYEQSDRQLGDARNYILEFNRYADESSWNEEAKMDAFLAGLNDQIANRILEMFPGPRSLSSMQTIAARIDSRIAANRNFFNPLNRSNDRPRNSNSKLNKKKWNSKKTSNSKFHGPLSNEEKERRKRENLCLYCGSSQYTLDNCPLKNKNKNNNSNKNKPVALIFPILKSNLTQDQEFLIQISQSMNSL